MRRVGEEKRREESAVQDGDPRGVGEKTLPNRGDCLSLVRSGDGTRGLARFHRTRPRDKRTNVFIATDDSANG
jgi:hypothetical protein